MRKKWSARCSYKEQMTRKMHLDELTASWQRTLELEARERGEVSSSSGKTSRSSVSKSMSRSSKLSTVSRKREKLALAQLKRTQLFKQHELERKMAELNYQKEAMEAQMEEERALVSLHVYDKEVDVVSKEEDTNKYTATGVLQQPQTLSPFAQPYVTQVPPEQPSNMPPQPVHTASFPMRNVEQFEVQLQSAQPYVIEVPPEQQQNMLSQPVLITHLPREEVKQPHAKDIDRGEEMVRALRQVVSMPKIKYMHFNGDAINYASFMHNFETCLEKDNPDNCTRLQLLIQHCNGKAREAIESCGNLPAEEGYNTAKNTLYENFGKPHIIAKAYIKGLMNLPFLKQPDGASLLEFTRYLEVADRTLTSMGPQYESKLNHTNTLRELNRKLPLIMQVPSGRNVQVQNSSLDLDPSSRVSFSL